MSDAAFPLLPERYWCEGTEGSTWDPVVLRARAEAHRGHRFDHKMDGVNAGLLLYLLDVWEAAKDAADWHEGKSGHITDRNLVDAVRGIER